MTQFELIKQLEYAIAFQTNCLREGEWDTFDKTEDTIRQLEKKILLSGAENGKIE